MQKEETHLRYLLEWAQEDPFLKVNNKRPTLPEYLKINRLDGKEDRLSDGYIKRILATARRFFMWLSDEVPGYRSIKKSWINKLKTKRMSSIPRYSEAVSFDEILAIAHAPAVNTAERRIKASAVILFLSGMRIGAFVSMPLCAVDIDNYTVYQHPNLGVRTKNRKHETTFLIEIPELIKVIKDWDIEVRKVLGNDGFWFAPLSPKTGEIDPTNKDCPLSRSSLFVRQLKNYCDKYGLKYHSSHKFRHGHIHYLSERAQSIKEYKSIAQNTMHSSMKITDEYYTVMDEDNRKDSINKLSRLDDKQKENVNIYELIQEVIKNKNEG